MNNVKIKAKEYNRAKINLRFASITYLILYLCLFQLFISKPLAGWALRTVGNFPLALGVYLLVFSILYYIIDFPRHFYSTFRLEHRFGLSNQKIKDWVKDETKGGILSFTLFLLFVEALYVLLKISGNLWWILLALFWFFVTVIIARITPTLIIPLFFKYAPVESTLKMRIMALSKKCELKILDVYKIDFSKKTNKVNAALVGLGKSRRVILADTLINDFTEEEIEGVLAHEFAHHKLRHIMKMLLHGFLATVLLFYVLYLTSSITVRILTADAVYDLSIFPAFILILFLVSFLLQPIQNWYSRVLEKEADEFAVNVTKNKKAFISLMKKLAERNLADPNPSKIVKYLFYDHPPISERIRRYEKK